MSRETVALVGGGSREAVSPELERRVRACFGQGAALRPIGVPVKAVADDPIKRLVVDQRDRPRAVVHWARSGVPGRVARDVERLTAARQALGEALGDVVLCPRESGWIESRSYAIVEYRRPVHNCGAIGYVERAQLRPRILRWLRRVAARTQRDMDDVQPLRDAIEHLVALEELAGWARRLVAAAGDRLMNDPDAPRHVFSHNDLWAGNMLHARRGEHAGFTLIDWGGSRPDGYPIYDLVRAARSLRIGPRTLRREVQRHCTALGCRTEHAVGHLAAALGQLGLNREHFPMHRYVALVEGCLTELLEANVVHRRAA